MARPTPTEIALAVEAYLRSEVRVLAQAAVDRLSLALRGVPVQDQDRLLPALRRRDGPAAPVQRHPGPRGARVRDRRADRRRHLRRDAPRRPRLGRGVLPRGRLGAVRPDPRRGSPRRRGRADERAGRGDRRSKSRRRLGHAHPSRLGHGCHSRRDPPARPRPRPQRRRRRRHHDGVLTRRRLDPVGRRSGTRSRRLARGPRAAPSPRPPPRCTGGAAAHVAGARLRRSAGPRHGRRRRPRHSTRPPATCGSGWTSTPGDLPTRLQAVLFGGRAATPADLADLADFRRRLRRRLREREGRTKALLALYGLRAQAPQASPRLAPRHQAF